MKSFKLMSGPIHWYHYAVIVLTIAGGVSLLAYTNRSKSSQNRQTEQSQRKEYEYAELGSQCNLASIKLKHKSETLKTQAEKDYAQINSELAQTEAQLSANNAHNNQVINDTRSDLGEIYNQGGTSYERYSDQLDNTYDAQNRLGGQSGSIQSEINRLRTENAKHYEESKKRAAEYLTDATKLEACAASASAEKQFSVGDVAEFQALITKSEQP